VRACMRACMCECTRVLSYREAGVAIAQYLYLKQRKSPSQWWQGGVVIGLGLLSLCGGSRRVDP